MADPSNVYWFLARRHAAAHPRSNGRPSAVIVERSVADALPVLSMLVAWDFHVTVADHFADAKSRLSDRPPDLLITELRLGEYNGLELVLRGKSRRPDMAALVVTRVHDIVLQQDAEQMGATFVMKPVDEPELRAATFRTLFRRAESTKPIRAPFERRSRDRRGAVRPVAADRRTAERRRDPTTAFATVQPAEASELREG